MLGKESVSFIGILLLCAWWCIATDESPKTTLDLTQQTLISPEQNLSSPPPQLNTLSQTITYFDIPNTQISAHASAITNVSSVSDKDFMLLYFAGSREGARDVGIYQSFFTFESHNKATHNKSVESLGSWSEPHRLLDAQKLSQLSGKFIKKLGNPIAFVDRQNRVHLFVVGVSLGGWATSKIYWLRLDSILSNLSFVKELHLSPFFNFSHLVRTPPMLKEDGGFILPIYHELANKYPLLLDFSPTLQLDSITKPLELHSQLQPSFIPLDSHTAFGVYRNHKAYNNVLFTSLCDEICQSPKTSNLQSFDFSSVLFRSLDSTYLLHNQTQRENGNKREELWIMNLNEKSLDSESVSFEPVLKLDSFLGNEVSYPSVAESDEYVAVAYTYRRLYIRVALIPKAVLKNPIHYLTQGGGQK
ncbi:sialidase family protein [Helicobacter cinaedi]|uniref:BNR/Asp-box repeat-containing protein n=1 Tax=Helicobacter cinaedi TaxID=213 RepID=A0A377JPC7_9HELI|nr:sialidase family protein [Helicobacter cinaedi]STP09547.1 BNR/Asp-box repeat-containing protein [Helicobacter cinaedi]